MIKNLVFCLIMSYTTISFAEAKEKVEDNHVVKTSLPEVTLSSCINSSKIEWKVANLLR